MPESAPNGHRYPCLWLIALCLGGCATTKPVPLESLTVGQTAFYPVGIVDFRSDTIEDYKNLVRPGDLIVNYMRLGRAAKKREWLFALLPYGHSMLVIDPEDPRGLLECRFHGIRHVGADELKLYSYNVVYRLQGAERLNMDRLREFGEIGETKSQGYSFASWVGRNDYLTPDQPDQISPKYTCSTMVVAAYHYAGVTLSAAEPAKRVITPVSLAASAGKWNQHIDPTQLATRDETTSY